MPWDTSKRRDELPSNWQTIRLRILRRDKYSCQQRDEHGRMCLRPANQVDHVKRGSNHASENLQALCSWHHGRKSSREGFEARTTAALCAPLRRPDERHPAEVHAARASSSQRNVDPLGPTP